jgi:hypothetical protein
MPSTRLWSPSTTGGLVRSDPGERPADDIEVDGAGELWGMGNVESSVDQSRKCLGWSGYRGCRRSPLPTPRPALRTDPGKLDVPGVERERSEAVDRHLKSGEGTGANANPTQSEFWHRILRCAPIISRSIRWTVPAGGGPLR